MSSYSPSEWIDVKERLPPRDNVGDFGGRYSVPVLVGNITTKQIWEEIVRYDYEFKGWCPATLEYISYEYEICTVSHYCFLPQLSPV